MTVKSFTKLEPRRFIPDSELVSIGGNQYTTTFLDREPSAAWQDRGGIDPTSISFSWDDATKTTTITTSSAPNENVFLDYFLYFTTSTVSYVEQDPVTPSGDIVRWDPRLTAHPSIPESASNMLNGVLSTSSTNVSIDNNDYAYNKYMTKYDNYKNKQAIIYAYINDTYSILAYGYITGVKTSTRIVVNIKSTNKLLEIDATLDNSETDYQYSLSKWPSMDDGFDGKPIPVQYGPLSQQPGDAQEVVYQSNDATRDFVFKSFPNDHIQVKCPYIGNDRWFLGIVDNPWSRTSWEYVPVTYLNATQYSISSDYLGYFVQGNTYMFKNNADTFRSPQRVTSVDYSNSILNVEAAFASAERVAMFPASVWIIKKYDNTPATFDIMDVMWSVSNEAVPTHLNPSPVWDFVFEATDSGQYFVYLDIDPAGVNYADFVGQPCFAILHSKQITQTAFLEKYIESTGIEVDSTSFAQAQSDVDTNVMITVNRDFKMNTVREVVENVSTSCNGILYLDTETNKYKYKIVTSSLAGTDHTVSSNDILEPDIIPSVSYSDTANIVRMNHPYTKDVPYTVGTSVSQTSSFSRALNSESRSKSIDHFLTDASDAIDFKSETFNTPMVTYTFTLPSEHFFNIDIGDIIQIENVDGRLLQTGDSVRLLVVSRTRSVEKIKLVGYEFTKIP
jgi:hypothetical protein